MASVNPSDNQHTKASSLTEQAVSGRKKATPVAGGVAKNAKDALETRVRRGGKSRAGAIIVDIILLVLLAGLVVGGVFGYRALKNAYAPKWEERQVEIRIELTDVDPYLIPNWQEWAARAADGESLYLYASEAADAEILGAVAHVNGTVDMPATEENPAPTTKKCTLTLRATVRYRAEVGYYAGSYHLLAGRTGVFRVGGMVADGTILSVFESGETPSASVETQTAVATAESKASDTADPNDVIE